MKILVVCLGNICRSPIAHGIFEDKLPPPYYIDSAGTAGYHVGNPPDKRSIQVAQEYGIDISQQQCRKVSISDFENFDVIFAMDESNMQNLLKICPEEHKYKVEKILDYHNGVEDDVPDPYYGEINDFRAVYNLLESAIGKYIRKRDLN